MQTTYRNCPAHHKHSHLWGGTCQLFDRAQQHCTQELRAANGEIQLKLQGDFGRQNGINYTGIWPGHSWERLGLYVSSKRGTLSSKRGLGRGAILKHRGTTEGSLCAYWSTGTQRGAPPLPSYIHSISSPPPRITRRPVARNSCQAQPLAPLPHLRFLRDGSLLWDLVQATILGDGAGSEQHPC